ncbi:MAG: hypothetical protein Tsb0016_03450 [Sphingomonadales bacterium]
MLLGVALAACGGSGGAGPTANLAPAAPPPPPPPPENFDTAEFRANFGLDAINVLGAYDSGVSGSGVTVAVIDTGIDSDHFDLAAAIHPASRNVNGGTSFIDDDGHGTQVSGIIAARRNNAGSHGVAFNAQIMALRADIEGSCADECQLPDNAIASGIDHAVANGARIINLSLGGSPANFRLAQSIRAATAAGAMVVISAGNDGGNEPDPLALIAADPDTQGRVVIAGASTASNSIASFSNRAGTAAQFFVMAPGAGVTTTDLNGGSVVVSGTSFAAPHVAGALALLLENFPTTDATSLLEILKTTARDLGDPGVDLVHGWGLIDVAAAMAPQGVATVPLAQNRAGATLAASIGQSPAALGDALFQVDGLSQVLFTDAFDRAFLADLGQQFRPRPMGVNLLDRLRLERATVLAGGALGPGLALTLQARRQHDLSATAAAALDPLMQSNLRRQRQPAFRLDGTWQDWNIVLSHGHGAFAHASVAHGADGLSQAADIRGLLGGDGTTALMAARHLRGGLTLGLRAAFGREDGDGNPLAPNLPGQERATRHVAALSLGNGRDHALAWDLSLGAALERNMLLGSPSSGALRLADAAHTAFMRLSGDYEAGNHWQFTAALMLAKTRLNAAQASVFADPAGLWSSAWHADISRHDVFQPNDRLRLRLAQPLRAEAGQLRAQVPVGRDFSQASGGFLFTDQRVALSPSGRQIDVELGYRRNFGASGGTLLSADVLYRHDAGHVAGASDLALLLRWQGRF